MNKDAVLIEEYRGNLLENIHRGHICVIDENADIVYKVGDPKHITYMRSSAKPIQALAFFAMRLDEKYGLTDTEKTILAGSHMGGPYHIEALESIAHKMNIQEETLVLLPTYPANEQYRDEAKKAGFSA
ncbi:MAG: asparaginase, partial [Ruthenibacterium sp.]